VRHRGEAMQHLHVLAPHEKLLGFRTGRLVQERLPVLGVDAGRRGPVLVCDHERDLQHCHNASFWLGTTPDGVALGMRCWQRRLRPRRGCLCMRDIANMYGDAVKVTQLYYLRAAADLGSFSRAAASLGVSQPALSNGIAALERVLGGQLFARSTTGVAPTALA